MRWHAAGEGSDSPLDGLLDLAEATVTVGLRQLCCEQGIAGRSFARNVANLKSAAQVAMGEDLFRQVVESEGKAVLKASADEQLEIDWSAAQCKTPVGPAQPAVSAVEPGGLIDSAPGEPAPEAAAATLEVSRIYGSCDGVIVPTTTDQEKHKRRATTMSKRRQMRPQKRAALAPLATMKKGSDQRYKQIYLSCFYDQGKEHRLVGVTRKDHRGLGQLLKRDAARIHLRAAQERVGLIDGAVCLRRHLEVLPLQEVVLDFRHLSEHVNDGKPQDAGGGHRGRQGIQRPGAACGAARRVRAVLHETGGLAWRPAGQQAEGGRSAAELPGRASGDDAV